MPSIFQPLGLAYIAAVLEESHEVHILDALAEGWSSDQKPSGSCIHYGLTFSQIASKIENLSPDIVGVTIPYSTQSQSAYRVVEVAKQVNKNIARIKKHVILKKYF